MYETARVSAASAPIYKRWHCNIYTVGQTPAGQLCRWLHNTGGLAIRKVNAGDAGFRPAAGVNRKKGFLPKHHPSITAPKEARRLALHTPFNLIRCAKRRLGCAVNDQKE